MGGLKEESRMKRVFGFVPGGGGVRIWRGVERGGVEGGIVCCV